MPDGKRQQAIANNRKLNGTNSAGPWFIKAVGASLIQAVPNSISWTRAALWYLRHFSAEIRSHRGCCRRASPLAV